MAQRSGQRNRSALVSHYLIVGVKGFRWILLPFQPFFFPLLFLAAYYSFFGILRNMTALKTFQAHHEIVPWVLLYLELSSGCLWRRYCRPMGERGASALLTPLRAPEGQLTKIVAAVIRGGSRPLMQTARSLPFPLLKTCRTQYRRGIGDDDSPRQVH